MRGLLPSVWLLGAALYTASILSLTGPFTGDESWPAPPPVNETVVAKLPPAATLQALPQAQAPLVLAARQLNPKIEITVRARYLQERETLEQAGAATIVFEEGEAGIAMARQVLMRRGMDNDKVEQLLRALRKMWSIADEPTVRDRLAAQER